jgi:hypothetical protein
MPATYEPIATQTLTGSVSSITFSSIPSTYTDLVLVMNANSGGFNTAITFNGTGGSAYSFTRIYGDGSSSASDRQSNQSSWIYVAGSDTGTSKYGTAIIHLMNYANTTTYKTGLMRTSNSAYVMANVGLWQYTNAINSITVSASFTSGSMFTLYGIKAA